MKYLKVQGCGNDGVLLDAADPVVALLVEDPGFGALVRSACDRHLGIGADVVLVMSRPTVAGAKSGADVRMRIFNADGAEAQMCSTGVRAIAKHFREVGGRDVERVNVETGRGVLPVILRIGSDGRVSGARVEMGEPILEPARVPVRFGGENAIEMEPMEDVASALAKCSPNAVVAPRVSCVSMGNPHLIIWCGNMDAVPLDTIGPRLEQASAFPERVNVHFVEVCSRGHVRAKHWERGAGATLACGTGSCAIVVAGVLSGKLDRRVRVDVPGGAFSIEWDELTNQVVLEGAIEFVATGEWSHPLVAEVLRGRGELPVLRTERLLLRSFVQADAPRIVELAGDRRIAEMTSLMPHPYLRSHAEEWVAGHPARVVAGSESIFALTRRCADGFELIGAMGLIVQRGHERAEMGYWIGVPYWGHGYCSEAAAAVVDYGFRMLNLQRIYASHYAVNVASGRVMQKIGMTQEGVLRRHMFRLGAWHDSVNYSIMRGEWEKGR